MAEMGPNEVIALVRKFAGEDDNVEGLPDTREECGSMIACVAALSEDKALLMIDNGLIVMASGFLNAADAADSKLMAMVCLQIFVNLACHDGPRSKMADEATCVEVIVMQLRQDDEERAALACRVLNSGLQSNERNIWAVGLQDEQIQARIKELAENAQNPELKEEANKLNDAINV